MRAPLFQIDAFTTTRFAGNPAAVVVLERYADDELLQAVAAENNLSETAFLVPEGDAWHIRWLTPRLEVPLCGHATLASAWVVLERLHRHRDEVTFLTRWSGALHARRAGEAYAMSFPSRPTRPIDASPALAAALGARPTETRVHATNYLAVFESAAAVRALTPDFGALACMDRDGVIVTAPVDRGYDCTSHVRTRRRRRYAWAAGT